MSSERESLLYAGAPAHMRFLSWPMVLNAWLCGPQRHIWYFGGLVIVTVCLMHSFFLCEGSHLVARSMVLNMHQVSTPLWVTEILSVMSAIMWRCSYSFRGWRKGAPYVIRELFFYDSILLYLVWVSRWRARHIVLSFLSIYHGGAMKWLIQTVPIPIWVPARGMLRLVRTPYILN